MAGAPRDLETARRALEQWWSRRIGSAVTVSDLSIPKAGFSNETIIGAARVEGAEVEFVARIEPTDHQLFLEPSAAFQAAMMRSVGRTGRVPVPEVILEEQDASVLGAPFFLMKRVEGRIPPDRPCWHEGGWTAELVASDRTRLYDNGLRALVALHSIDPDDGFEFLARPGEGDALGAYLDHVCAWYDWSKSSLVSGPDVVMAALEYVRAGRPADGGRVCVTWGDARVGNLIFDEDLEVAAVLDWEGAALGPAGIDVGWWLMFEQFFCEAAGVARLDGVADREGTIARYEELAGRKIDEIRYYEILAGLVFALINNRLAHLAITEYGAPRDRATAFVDRNVALLGGWLAELG